MPKPGAQREAVPWGRAEAEDPPGAPQPCCARAMAVDRRREAAGSGPGRQPATGEENGALPARDVPAAAATASSGLSGDPHPGAPSLLLLDYDGSVLPFLGGLGGGYQKTLVVLTWVPALFIGFSQFSDSFLLDQPDYWCRGAGQDSESASGVTVPGRWGAGDLANWTYPATTPFSTASWGATDRRGNSSGLAGPDTPPLESPPDQGENASNCDCHAWEYRIRSGLVQNVVSKVRLPPTYPPTPRRPTSPRTHPRVTASQPPWPLCAHWWSWGGRHAEIQRLGHIEGRVAHSRGAEDSCGLLRFAPNSCSSAQVQRAARHHHQSCLPHLLQSWKLPPSF